MTSKTSYPNRARETRIAWSLVASYAALIFILSSLPGSNPILKGLEKYVWDKLLHLLEYLFLGILLVRALALSFKYRSLEHLVFMAFVFGGLYALSDEWHQNFVPLRDANLYDWLADSIGILLGAYFFSHKIIRELKREQNA